MTLSEFALPVVALALGAVAVLFMRNASEQSVRVRVKDARRDRRR